MKRALAITLTVALFGALAVVGLTGAAAAQEDTDNISDVDELIEQTIGDIEATQEQNLQSGDANVDVSVDQTNNNAQTASATAGDALALDGSSGGAGAAAAGHAKYKSGSGAGAAADGASAGATAFSTAEVAQSQDVDQTNAANVDATAETGNVSGEQDLEQEPEQESEVGNVTVGDDGDGADGDDGTNGDEGVSAEDVTVIDDDGEYLVYVNGELEGTFSSEGGLLSFLENVLGLDDSEIDDVLDGIGISL
ncbi:hypothetical protein [Halopiger thermotolerans]